MPPVYPFLLAAIFRIFGVFTSASYWAAVAMNIVVHAVSCVVLYWAAEETFGRRAAWCAAMALGSFPLLFQPLVWLHILGGGPEEPGLLIPPNMIWNTHLLELTIVVLIWITLRKVHWAIYGAVWGVAALIDPVALSLAPVYFAWKFWRRDRWRSCGFAILTATLCVAPWLVRNYLVFHRPVFLRDGLGIELRVGNEPGNRGLWSANLHPDRNPYELKRYAAMGEVAYARADQKEAIAIILAHPGEFAKNTLLRIEYFWIGTPMSSHRLHALRFLKYLPALFFSLFAFWGAERAIRQRNQKAWLFIAVLLFVPLVHYITHTFDGFTYQYPIQAEMLALSFSVVFKSATESQGTEVASFDQHEVLLR